jgi:ABC-2 type transport system permease protein
MRILHLFGAIISLSLKRELAFRVQLVFQILLAATRILASVIALGIVYTHTKTLGGWRLGESITLLGIFEMMSGFLSAFIEPNLQWFNSQVKEGKLDALLLQPVPSIFLASLGSCAPLELANVVLGAILIGVGLHNLGIIPTLWNIIGWLIMFCAGIVITWASRLLLASLAFWAPSIDPDIFYGAIWQFGRYPTNIYRQPIRFTLTYLLPIAFISTIPSQVLIHGSSLPELFTAIALAGSAFIAIRLIWNAGLRRYTGATS